MFCPVLAEISMAPEASRPITSSICSLTRAGSAAGRSILLSTGTISWPGLDRLIDIGERLRLDALARIDDQERALAGGEASGSPHRRNRHGRACP